jgi:hypothetical protein
VARFVTFFIDKIVVYIKKDSKKEAKQYREKRHCELRSSEAIQENKTWIATPLRGSQ